MNKLDILYQQAVQEKAHTLLASDSSSVKNSPPFGEFTVLIEQRVVKGGFWHHAFNNGIHHIYFQLQRRVLLIFHKNYLSGVKVDSGENIELLSPEELANYD